MHRVYIYGIGLHRFAWRRPRKPRWSLRQQLMHGMTTYQLQNAARKMPVACRCSLEVMMSAWAFADEKLFAGNQEPYI